MTAVEESLFLENQLCFPLYAASRLTTKMYAPLLKELDLTYPQYLVLLVLWKEDNQTVNQIGQALFLESNTITPLLKRLEEKGLVKRQRSQQDERVVEIKLTAPGIELKQKAVNIPATILDSFKGEQVNKKEMEAFQKTLFKLVDVLDQYNKKN